MGVYEGRGQLTKAMRDLRFRWQETRGAWFQTRARAK